MNDRYNKIHFYGEVEFYLADFIPHEEQCRVLMLKVLEQAVRDYCSLAESSIQTEKDTWQTAKSFIYDDEHYFMWGDLELNLESFLDILDLDLVWTRKMTTKRFENRKRKNG